MVSYISIPMARKLVRRPTANLPATTTSIAALTDYARKLIEAADAPNTRRAYKYDLIQWRHWCRAMNIDARALPVSPEVAAAWLAHQSSRGLTHATLRRRATWLDRVHRDAGVPSPTDSQLVATLLRGARRVGAAPKKKHPITITMIRLSASSLSTRDFAIAIVGFVTGLRRADLASLRWGQIEKADDGHTIRLGQTKTTKESTVSVPEGRGALCPVKALARLAAEQGKPDPLRPVFGVCDATIGRLAKKIAELNGKDPRNYGGHSFRAGFVTESNRLGQGHLSIMKQTGHKSPAVSASYNRPSETEVNPAARALVDALEDTE